MPASPAGKVQKLSVSQRVSSDGGGAHPLWGSRRRTPDIRRLACCFESSLGRDLQAQARLLLFFTFARYPDLTTICFPPYLRINFIRAVSSKIFVPVPLFVCTTAPALMGWLVG